MANNTFKLKISTLENGNPEEEFPKEKEGKRCKVDISSVNDTTLKGNVESIVLTLLKNDDNIINNLFSLSIKLNKSSNITSSTLNIPIDGENKYIYNINKEDSITKLYNVSQQNDIKLTHILIIGTATKNSNNFTFTANKSIFVTNTTEELTEQLTSEETPFKNLLTIEEFLNLRYIDYFSFDNEKFNELYKGISQRGGGISTKIKIKSK